MNGRLPGWKPGSCGWGSSPPFIVTKKIEKKNIPINIEPPYKYTMQYIRETYKNVSIYIYICMPSKLKHFANILHPTCGHMIYLNDY